MSLRVRLLIGMCLVAVVLGIVGVVVARSTEAHLVDQVDQRLEATPLLGVPPPVAMEEGPPVPLSYYIASVAADGSVETVYTPDLAGEDDAVPKIDGEEVLAVAAEGRAPFTVGGEGSGKRYRALARLDPRSGGAVVLALSLSDVDDAMGRLVIVEVVAGLGVLAVLGLVTWWVIRHGFRPLKQMTATATAIAGGDLSSRVPDVTIGTEVGELGAALNRMLGRIETAFDERTRSEARLRQFTADASHELRTPVATVRGYAELYRSGGLADEDALGEAMRRTEEEAVRMGALIDDMLYLVRHDQGRPLTREPVDLAVLVDDAVRDAAAVEPSRPVTAAVDGSACVLGDQARLRQMLGNLLGNALVHTAPETPVEVRLQPAGSRVVLEVADQGPGMSTEAASRAFERFYRADPSRSRNQGGAGLGLAIVEATVTEHDGNVTLISRTGVGTTVRVELPAAGPV